MSEPNKPTVRILRWNEKNLELAKDEEYAYWQNQPPLDRLLATQELSFAFFEGRVNEAEIRQQFLRSPVCLPR